MQLSKPDKKVARALIDKGLLIEFTRGLNESKNILDKWAKQEADTKETYHTLFGHIQKLNKHIAATYDDLGGSQYFDTVLYLFLRNILTEADIADFSEEVRAEIHRIKDFRKR